MLKDHFRFGLIIEKKISVQQPVTTQTPTLEASKDQTSFVWRLFYCRTKDVQFSSKAFRIFFSLIFNLHHSVMMKLYLNKLRDF